MTELRVNTGELANGGNGLAEGARAIPEPLQPLVTSGTDALSLALNARTNEIEQPLIEGMPKTKAEALATAENIIRAAGMYEQTDQEIADRIRKALDELDGAGAPGAGVSGGASGAEGAAGAGGGAAPAAGGADAMGQMGQMLGMPLQMAQQAAQIPMQLAGMAASIPQQMMQGLQGGMQQIGQMTGQRSEMGGKDDKDRREELEDRERPDERSERPEPERAPEGAAAGDGGGERAPEYVPRHAAPETPPVEQAPEAVPVPPKPAPTRPAEADPSILL
ncbi:hypothetical protein [Mycobacterium sp. PS03-16]|uniref:hypothetical protein n=1 Tax=Mycobacterium sp. PS03-16 TaxID=2559611 RepID=UPI001FD76711|nr:hypothetical protein [Mycobacterium sp. PS03-16]